MAISFFSLSATLLQVASASTLVSPDGHFAATLRGGEVVIEKVAADGARERAWSAAHACDPAASAHLLADGGLAFAHVSARVASGTPPVVVLAPEGKIVAADAPALDLRAEDAAWIELSPRAMRLGRDETRGASPRLDLFGRDGRLRTIDLASGRVDVPRSEHAAVDVMPSALPEGGRLMIVGSWSAPCAAAAGEPLQVEVVLLIPKPLPQKPTLDLAGFQVLAREKEAVWEILPLGRPAKAPEPQAHELRAKAKLSGLSPGRHRLYVDGGNGSTGIRPPQEVLVVAGARRATLATSGGFIGQRRRIELWANGIAVDSGINGETLDAALVPFAAGREIERLLAALPGPTELPESVPPSAGADFVGYELSWSDASGPRHVVRDDGSLAEPLRAVIAALQQLVPPGDSASAGGRDAGNATHPGGKGAGASEGRRGGASGGGGATAAAGAAHAGNASPASNAAEVESSQPARGPEAQAARAAPAEPAQATPPPAQTPPGPATVTAATQAAQTPPASKVPRWTIDPKASRLAVSTKSGGLFSAFGHDHTLDARTFSGFLELDPAKLAEARLELSVDARSLAVTDKESKDDAAEIEENTRSKVLESERFPAISFTSTKVETKPLGTKGNAWKVMLTGDLALHGKTRSLVVPGSFTIEDGVLHALGEVEFDLSDWKIKPPSAAGGTVKVADRIKLSFDIVARKAK